MDARMLSFYDRYLRGNHEQVWSELTELREAVREEPVYSDALAVARETTWRARSNIETLIVRLHAIGYEFETERRHGIWELEEMGRERCPDSTKVWRQELLARYQAAAAMPEKADPLDETYVYVRAKGSAASEIADAEELIEGPLPLSLRAWYESIESVSFMGRHPVLNPYEPPPHRYQIYTNPAMFAALQTPPGGQEHIDYTQAAGCEIATTLPEGTGVLPDPLYIGPLDQLVNDALDPEVPGDCCSISPDAGMKANVSGDCYYVELPSFGMDVLFQDGRGKTFVDYLRRVCKWAGFPGWELERNPPIDLIRELTRDLLPL